MTKLEELIKQAAPLPWRETHVTGWNRRAEGEDGSETIHVMGWNEASRQQRDASFELALHAVNMLPKLVVELEGIASACNGEGWELDELRVCVLSHANKALAEANNPEVSK